MYSPRIDAKPVRYIPKSEQKYYQELEKAKKAEEGEDVDAEDADYEDEDLAEDDDEEEEPETPLPPPPTHGRATRSATKAKTKLPFPYEQPASDSEAAAPPKMGRATRLATKVKAKAKEVNESELPVKKGMATRSATKPKNKVTAPSPEAEEEDEEDEAEPELPPPKKIRNTRGIARRSLPSAPASSREPSPVRKGRASRYSSPVPAGMQRCGRCARSLPVSAYDILDDTALNRSRGTVGQPRKLCKTCVNKDRAAQGAKKAANETR